jgi:hypothetical protein
MSLRSSEREKNFWSGKFFDVSKVFDTFFVSLQKQFKDFDVKTIGS